MSRATPAGDATVQVLVPRWLIPVEPSGRVLEDHAVVIADGRIRALEPALQARSRNPLAEVIELPGHALIPGLVNAHGHAAMGLMRGLADDLPLMDWLQGHIWPAEAAHVSEAFVTDGTRLAVAEMLRGGITCFNDMYFFPEASARVAVEAGIRACLGMILIDFPSPYARDAAEYLQRGLDLHDAWRHHPLISTAFAPHAPYSVADAPLKRVRTLADQLEVPVHIHLHETAAEIEQGLQHHGLRPLERLARLGLLSPELIAVHMTQLEPGEIEAVARAGVQVVHCPESNLKLASGFCPVARLREAGVNLALGTDGAASNNDLDLFGEMKTAALLGKAVAQDAAALPAAEVLRMATLGGARALGLDSGIGSIEVGKWADLTAVRLSGVESEPLYDPISQLVYVGGRERVSDVWVAGRRLLRDRQLTSLDIDEVLSEARSWQERLRANA